MVRTDPLSFLSEQIESWKKAGTYQTLRQLQTACQPVCRVDGKEVINLASNNYLGLAGHPKLIEAAVEAARKYGAGSAAVRTIAGTMSIHLELDRR
ncbi:MAG TPA: aminotransferase class I/II-fold pyridoxal phosphate-dependent enzyme, partial [Bryobacteraceae bacterium]|nr:aminotransferase class I/II-fold pyridoxal phosphate-dependent enzyme [Bryobacteraceae bacterium]